MSWILTTQSQQPPLKNANCNFLFHSPPMAEFLPWNCEDKAMNIWEVQILRHTESVGKAHEVVVNSILRTRL